MKADSSEYHWAKLALSGSTLTLTIGKTGTTLDTKTRSASAGEYTLTVCFDGNLITGVGGSLTAAKLSTTVADGIYVGRSGTADFTHFEFHKHFAVGEDSACPNCQEPTVNCTACCNDLPFYIAADLDAALTEFTTACDGCPTIGGTYIVSNITPCSWNIIVPLCDSAVGGMGWCWRVNPEITEVHPSLQVGVSLQKNPATGKCYWAGLAGVVAAGACYNPAEDTFCDCTLTITCEESTIWPDCLTAPADGGMLAQAHYQSAEFDVGQCPPFPVIMQKVSQITGFPCKGDWPDTMTIQPA
jgi:hypothetical protein